MHTLRLCAKISETFVSSRPVTPTLSSLTLSRNTQPFRNLTAQPRKTAQGKVDCSCAGHPWPVEEVKVKIEKKKDCTFDFKKLEVNPFDCPCECIDPPPAAGCRDVGRSKDDCCRTIRKFGCYCEEEEEESCEEEEEPEEVHKGCDLDFKKLEVNPYDDPCECHDPPPHHSCADLGEKEVCCRTQKAFGCPCDAYDEPVPDCIKPKSTKQKREKKVCAKEEYKSKCL